MKRSVAAWLGLVLLLGFGCSSEPVGTVTGKVLVDGRPLGGFELTFISQATGAVALGYAKADGQYELFQGRGRKTVATGKYKVTVAPTEFVEGVPKPKVKLPKTVTDMTQTELVKTIEPGQNVLDFELSTSK